MTSFDHSLDKLYMFKCLALARRGEGHVSPNPMVGAVIVKSGKVIGYGYHKKFGGAHAEVHAIRSAANRARGSTLYVNLEPCNHFGKTPPCTNLIISSGIKEVVIGMRDPNPMIKGKGIKELRRAGIRVREGICKNECESLNEAFVKYISTGMPFVTLKIAQTLDGKIADSSGASKWITGSASRSLVHRLRSRSDSVLVGAGTIINDDPLLTVRGVKGKNPIRVIIDGRFRIPLTAKSLSNQSKAKTILFISERMAQQRKREKNILEKRGVEVIGLPSTKDGKLSVKHILLALGSRNIASLLVEGGTSIFSTLLDHQLADKVIVFIAPKILGGGKDAFSDISNHFLGDEIPLHDMYVHRTEQDLVVEAYLH